MAEETDPLGSHWACLGGVKGLQVVEMGLRRIMMKADPAGSALGI